MKAYIKDHKVVVTAVIFLLIGICLLFFINKVFLNKKSNVAYGNRLKGIEKVRITKEKQKKLISSIEDSGMVKKCEYDLQGKIINVIITLNDDIGAASAKSLADKVSEALSDEEKAFYDIQVFIKKDIEDNAFPIIGYKHNTKDSYSWTKDR